MKFPIGVIIDSFRTDIPTAVKKAAQVGAQGIQVYATSGEMSPEELVGSKRADFRRLVEDNGLVISALCGDLGGGFGNKQDALYEPLCAWCTTQVGGRPVRVDCSREETFVSNRVRHAIRFHIVSWLRKDGTFAARKVECFSNQGAYASHGHSIVAKGMGSFAQHYPCDNMESDAWTAPPPAPCAATVCRRRPLPTRPTWTTAPRRWVWTRWPSGCRISCPRALRTASATM